MKLNKGWIGVTFVALFLAVSLPAAAQENVILQLSVPVFAEDFIETAITEYEAQDPGIQIELVTYVGNGMPVEESDDAEEYQDNLAEYFSSADVLLVDSSLSSEATRAGYVLNLMPLTNSDLNFNPSDFHSTLLNSFMWDGGQWALPISTSFIVLTYQPEAFDEAGLSYPTASWTLDDLEFAASTLQQVDANGDLVQPGLVVLGGGAGAANLPSLFISLLGHGTVDESSFPNNPDFSDPQIETLLDQWQAMIDEGLLQLPQGFDINDVPMSIGNAGGFGGGGNPFGNNQNDPVEATALLPGGGAGLQVTGYAISSGTAYPEQAYDFLNYLISQPDVITASGGTVPALISADTETTENNNAGPGGFGGGPGGFGGFNAVSSAMEPLIDTALQNGIPMSELRYAEGITDALSTMQSDAVDARSALDSVESTLKERLLVADTRATTTRIAVQIPAIAQLTPGEVILNFAVLGGIGGGGRGGFALQDQWDGIIAQFVADDTEVGLINIDTMNPNQFADDSESVDCFYSSENLVPDLDLSLVLNLTPMLQVDPNYDPNDFVPGVLEQVQQDNQVYALPIHISPLVLRYDYDLYNIAGAIPPQGSWTVAEFEDSIRSLIYVMEDDQTPVVLNASGQSALLALIASYGGLPFDTRTDPPTLNFTDPATVTAVQQVLDLVGEGYIAYSSGGGFGGGGDGGNANGIPLYSNVLQPFSFGGFGGPGAFGGGPAGGNANTDTNAAAQTVDGFVTFPIGQQFNALPFDLGTAYISATTQHVDACYRFITAISETTDLFDSMPTRYSLINDPNLAASQSADQVAFYNAMTNLMAQPNTLLFPTNLNGEYFGMTNVLFDLFDRYIAGEVLDFETELADAQTKTQEYLTCIDNVLSAELDIQNLRASIEECRAVIES